MGDVARRTKALKVARALFSTHGSAFTIANLCEESDLSRSEFRRVFGTKIRLLESLTSDAVERSKPQSARKAAHANDDWYDRRFRILERAITSLEARIDVDAAPQPTLEPQDSAGATTARTGRHASPPRSDMGQETRPVLAELPPSGDGTADAEPSRAAGFETDVLTLPPDAHVADRHTSDNLPELSQAPQTESAEQSEDETLPSSDSAMERAATGELPPIVTPAPPPPTEEPATQISRDGDTVGLHAAEPPPSGTVEKDVMRALLSSARAQLNHTVIPKTENQTANRQSRRLTVTASIAIIALGLIAGALYSDQSAGSDQKANSHPIHPQAVVSKKPNVTIINATGESDGGRERLSRSATALIKKARQGDVDAQSKLALAYLRGDGVPADPAAALGWSQMAAAQGSASAQFLLGTLYASGVKPDPQSAARWFAAAAAKGNRRAMHNLAIAYLNGTGVSKEIGAALAWFGKAASAGYTDSAFDLAVLYERGEGLPQDPRLAIHWYAIAAARGDSEAARRVELLRTALQQPAVPR